MLAVAAGSEHLTRAMRALEAVFLIGVAGVTEVWLVRHGDCYEGMTETEDPPLSPLGRKQAALLAERVHHAKPAAVYSSPYRRALETARTITDDVRVDERLIEMAVDVSDEGQLDFKEPPDGVIARMQSAVSDMAREHHGQRVVAIGHGAAIIAYLSDVMNLEPGRLRLLPYYTSVSVVRILGDHRMVGGLTDVAHLE
jgi:2,3-bisphosphoglycerate-dependent phosphoglycerate mutase